MIFLKKTKHFFNILLATLIIATHLISCSKNESAPIQLAGVSFIQAVPITEKVHLYISNERINEMALNFGNKLDYANVYPGDRRFTLNNEANNFIYSEVFSIEPQVGYSLFATGNPSEIKFLLLKDDLTKPDAGKARIRFINLSPDAPGVDLTIGGQSPSLFTNKKFKEYSTFENIDASDNLALNIKNATTGAMVVNLSNVKIEAGKIYTIYNKGYYNTLTGAMPISLSIFAHK